MILILTNFWFLQELPMSVCLVQDCIQFHDNPSEQLTKMTHLQQTSRELQAHLCRFVDKGTAVLSAISVRPD